MALCLGSKSNGKPCDKKGGRTTGFCTECDARNRGLPKAVVVLPTAEGNMVDQELLDMIPAVENLEQLRKMELKIIDGLVTGVIDPKCGSSVAALCKHQAELIEKLKPKEEKLDETGRQAAINISIQMKQEERWSLMQDFTGGFAKLLKEAQQKTITIPAEGAGFESQLAQITMERGNAENKDSERPAGILEEAGDTEEVF